MGRPKGSPNKNKKVRVDSDNPIERKSAEVAMAKDRAKRLVGKEWGNLQDSLEQMRLSGKHNEYVKNIISMMEFFMPRIQRKEMLFLQPFSVGLFNLRLMARAE